MYNTLIFNHLFQQSLFFLSLRVHLALGDLIASTLAL
jgi:hypothetical protein